MHLQDSSDSFFLALYGVIHVRAGRKGSGINSEEGQLSYERVCHDLKCQRRERLLIAGMSYVLFSRIRVYALDRRNVKRRRHIVYYSVQHHLYALVSVCASAEHRDHRSRYSLFSDSCLYLLDGKFLSLEEFHHQLFVGFCNRFYKLFSPFVCKALHVGRNIGNIEFLTKLILVDLCFHLY